MSKKFKTQIGLEIHVQLKTKAKMFCGCDNDAQGKEPNTVICPICIGMPGTLPVANKTAIEMTIKTGLALGSKIPKVSKFDRKHYFYPDLPKGYQISQYDMPFARGGELEVKSKNEKVKSVRLNRVHLEEDAGKLSHPQGSKYSIVDLNRAGTPLMEIVTEPDIKSPAEAREFLKELQIILRHIAVSDADMEKGHLRCDANISIKLKVKSEKLKEEMSEIVEIKNLNSFKFAEKALAYEEKRLTDEYSAWPEKKTKVTRGFDSKTNTTFIQREKEESKDYRYFPEPDIPPFIMSDQEIKNLKVGAPALPSQKKQELINSGISQSEADIIIKNNWMLKVIRLAENLETNAKIRLGKIIVHEKNAKKQEPEFLIDLAKKAESETLSSDKIRKILNSGSINLVLDEDAEPDKINLIVDTVLSENPTAVEKIKSGKVKVIGFLIGQVIEKSNGKIEPNIARDEITKRIEGKNGG